ncbi:MAG: ComEC/Rec2 family competence protein [Myxococcaceae bacterium]
MFQLRRLLLVFALLACALASAAGPLPLPEAGRLTVYFLDVGQGDASLIVSPTGRTVLVDGGPPDAARSLVQRLGEVVQGPLDLVLLTHPHLDHLGGLTEVLARFGARRYLDPGFDHPSSAYRQLLEAVAAHEIQYVEPLLGEDGEPVTIGLGGGASLTVLWPRRPGQAFLSGTRSDANANSIVFRLSYGETSFLFTGDAEADTENLLLRSGQDLRASVLKVAHHGSRHSSQAPFLTRVKPEAAVISCAAGNEYRHPHGKALQRLQAVGARVFRTDISGDIVAVSDGKSLRLDTVSPPSEMPSRVEATASTGPPPLERLPNPPGYSASRRSEVFHLADCPNVQQIQPGNLLRFGERADAAKGRRPAKDCNP